MSQETEAARMLSVCATLRATTPPPHIFLNQMAISDPAPCGLDGTCWQFSDSSVLIINSGGCFATGVGFIKLT
jgi:hypothetical protein